MLSYEEEILLEQVVSYENMSEDSRDLCINLLLNTKELSDSEYFFPEKENERYKIYGMSFKSDGYKIFFNGIACNNNENRYIDGIISKKLKRYYVAMNTHRLNEYVDDDEKDFSSLDIFTEKEDCYIRKTSYTPSCKYFEAQIPLFTDEELYDEYQRMIRKK